MVKKNTANPSVAKMIKFNVDLGVAIDDNLV